MTTDDATAAARAAAEDYASTPRMNVGTVRDRIAEAYLAGAAWGREQALAQEPTDAEVDAAARALDLEGAVYAFNGDRAAAEVDVTLRPLSLDSARGEELQIKARAALTAARAVRRDEETR